MPHIAEQARILCKKHTVQFNLALVQGRKADAVWHWDQSVIWGGVHVRNS